MRNLLGDYIPNMRPRRDRGSAIMRFVTDKIGRRPSLLAVPSDQPACPAAVNRGFIHNSTLTLGATSTPKSNDQFSQSHYGYVVDCGVHVLCAGQGDALGAGLIGLGIGAIVGSALTPREVYVAPPPAYYGPGAYGPPAFTPEWYSYCSYRYRSFNPSTGYFVGYDGFPHFCQ